MVNVTSYNHNHPCMVSNSVQTKDSLDEESILPSSNGSNSSLSSSERGSSIQQVQGSIEIETPSPTFKFIGIALAIFASLCISVVTLIVKFMENYHPVSKVIWRLQGVLLPPLAIVAYSQFKGKTSLLASWKKDESSCGKWIIVALLVARGVTGCSADIFQYYSLQHLPLADSTVISFSTPIFVCIVAHFVLGERCRVVPIFTAILTLCGVIIISKPPLLTGEEEMSASLLMGNMFALLCMVCGTLTTVLLRYLHTVHFSITMLAFGVFGTIEGLVVTLFTSPFQFPAWEGMDLLLAGIIAGLYFLGQLALTLSLKFEEAGIVSLIRTSEVIFSFIWQVNFLQQDADMFR
ncbi:unnamed protein product [Orchesella dallaii]|uniref:EamA domain-containing protein n=1 Tax=Orchesella dallaii TaxID=48710 RepID=A0ABP1QLC0_9HEXA